jgi:hypothetical protein
MPRPRGYTPAADAVLRIRARRMGHDVSTLVEREAAGEHWCGACRQWLARGAFASNAARSSGRASECKACNAMAKRKAAT